MKALRADGVPGTSSILVGDLNIAPLENDVWSHKQLLKIVSHTPVETEGMLDIMKKGNWLDLMRLNVPETEKIYTWWSYRARIGKPLTAAVVSTISGPHRISVPRLKNRDIA